METSSHIACLSCLSQQLKSPVRRSGQRYRYHGRRCIPPGRSAYQDLREGYFAEVRRGSHNQSTNPFDGRSTSFGRSGSPLAVWDAEVEDRRSYYYCLGYSIASHHTHLIPAQTKALPCLLSVCPVHSAILSTTSKCRMLN